ncbi:hypothetical protein HS048_35065 [Planomonospora sp. ID91781]|uniref:hypothetical protein n=1 Tax=Planomonospora sp. ID91781 TaxID=2738135 RepID=UPI0018C3E886|nr:hypothetical protein [Planomonospora sp. ID91781]MBG0825896.1 hypothetical protein [Planomonospora sp. ID91781]
MAVQHPPAIAVEAPRIGHICERATSATLTSLQITPAGVDLRMDSPGGLEHAVQALHWHGYEALCHTAYPSSPVVLRVEGWSRDRVLRRIEHLSAAAWRLADGHPQMAMAALARTYTVPELRQLPEDPQLARSLRMLASLTDWLRRAYEEGDFAE